MSGNTIATGDIAMVAPNETLTTWTPDVKVKVLSYRDDRWQEPEQYTLGSLPLSEKPSVIFLAAKQGQPTADSTRLQQSLADDFGVPKWIWSCKTQNSNGYFSASYKIGHGQSRYVTVSHFLIKYVQHLDRTSPKGNRDFYDWQKLSFVTRWHKPDSHRAELLCFDFPETLQKRIFTSLSETPVDHLQAHPYAFHALLLEHVVSIYDTAIWDIRNFVRARERQRPTIEAPTPDYVAMHELARHVMHASEVSSMALNVIDSMLENVAKVPHGVKNAELDPSYEITRQRSLLHGMNLRSKSLEERLRNEINLAFHIASQHDSLNQAKLAHAAQIDSSATKTISMLGLVFLPGTFISAIFSMSFFNFTPAASPSEAARWSMSEKFWIYWVVTLPITAVTVTVWWYWQRNYLPSQAKAALEKTPVTGDHVVQVENDGKQKVFTF